MQGQCTVYQRFKSRIIRLFPPSIIFHLPDGNQIASLQLIQSFDRNQILLLPATHGHSISLSLQISARTPPTAHAHFLQLLRNHRRLRAVHLVRDLPSLVYSAMDLKNIRNAMETATSWRIAMLSMCCYSAMKDLNVVPVLSNLVVCRIELFSD